MCLRRAQGVKPNVRTYSVAIAACADAKEWQRALKLMEVPFFLFKFSLRFSHVTVAFVDSRLSSRTIIQFTAALFASFGGCNGRRKI